MAEKDNQLKTALFCENAVHRNDMDSREYKEKQFKVGGIIGLSDEEYVQFTSDFHAGYLYLKDNRELTGISVENGEEVYHCLLVKPMYQVEGILIIPAEGKDPVKVAYIADTSRLPDMEDVPGMIAQDVYGRMTGNKELPTAVLQSGTDDIRNNLDGRESAPKNQIITKLPFAEVSGYCYYEEVIFETTDQETQPFEITKVVELDKKSLFELESDISLDHSFVLDNYQYMQSDHTDSDIVKCVLFCSKEDTSGVLLSYDIQDELLFASYLEDIKLLDLTGIPTEQQTSWQCKARFLRSPQSPLALMGADNSKTNRMAVEKAVILTEGEYTDFLSNMQESHEFLFQNDNLTYYDPVKQEIHCILVKPVDSNEGVVVTGDSFSRVELAARIDDCDKLQIMTMEDKHCYSHKASNKAQIKKDVKSSHSTGRVR